MKVTLIDYTGANSPMPEHFAAAVLVFTKSTRLNMSASSFVTTLSLPRESLYKELEYMANTIPSSWEFVDYTFMVEGVTRAYTHQQVRTRAASYAQQSMRVTDMSGFSYRVPKRLKEREGVGEMLYVQAMEEINLAYIKMLEAGVAEEDARGILPTNILTNIVCKFNLRTLSDLVRSREGGRTQDEYREVVSAMGSEVLRVHPWADLFLYPKGRDYWKELESEVERAIPDLKARGPILKIIDKMRKQ